MRTLFRPALSLESLPLGLALWAAMLAAMATGARAQTYPNPYYTNQTYSYGLYLPQVPQPTGQDEIRAADGTSCRSNAASNDAYLDIGGIGGQGTDGAFTSGTVYGRVIVPLGTVPKRLDCTQLYSLEIERLKHELQMVKSGLGSGGFAPAANAGWDKSGWSDSKTGRGGGDAGTGMAGNGALNVPAKAKASLTAPSAGNRGLQAPANTMTTASLPVQTAPTASLGRANAVGANVTHADVEILPWSNLPAEPARVLTAVPSRKASRQAESGLGSPLQMIWLSE